MVKYIFALIFIAASLGSSAQSQKLTIFCRVANRGFSKVDVNYLVSPKILPDSIKNVQLIQPKKGNDIDVVLMRMSMMGWKIVTAEGNLGSSYPASYLLSKEIDISAVEKTAVARRLDLL
jgi:hypothetical protein